MCLCPLLTKLGAHRGLQSLAQLPTAAQRWTGRRPSAWRAATARSLRPGSVPHRGSPQLTKSPWPHRHDTPCTPRQRRHDARLALAHWSRLLAYSSCARVRKDWRFEGIRDMCCAERRAARYSLVTFSRREWEAGHGANLGRMGWWRRREVGRAISYGPKFQYCCCVHSFFFFPIHMHAIHYIYKKNLLQIMGIQLNTLESKWARPCIHTPVHIAVI